MNMLKILSCTSARKCPCRQFQDSSLRSSQTSDRAATTLDQKTPPFLSPPPPPLLSIFYYTIRKSLIPATKKTRQTVRGSQIFLAAYASKKTTHSISQLEKADLSHTHICESKKKKKRIRYIPVSQSSRPSLSVCVSLCFIYTYT